MVLSKGRNGLLERKTHTHIHTHALQIRSLKISTLFIAGPWLCSVSNEQNLQKGPCLCQLPAVWYAGGTGRPLQEKSDDGDGSKSALILGNQRD